MVSWSCHPRCVIGHGSAIGGTPDRARATEGEAQGTVRVFLVVRTRPTCDDGRVMTAAPTTAERPGERPVRKATRDIRHPVIGGVAAGLARHLGVPVLWVRAAFLVTAVLG